ncbi:MAG: DUF333 domain-containing protein [Patescibacteria group bacterium]|nr:DUF333 domain-containing protein [Patescibacteria group bacterium]
MNKKLIIGGVLVAIVLFLIGARLITGEDTWICEKGQWVKHGNPKNPKPNYPCSLEGQKASAQEETTLPNPASQNCLDKGGTLKQVEETAGTLGICQFSDGSQCEEWQFFRDECKVGQTKTADTAHPYSGKITQKGSDYLFTTDTGVEYKLKLPETYSRDLKIRLVAETNGTDVTIVAAETPPLSKVLVLKGFQEK